MSPSRYVAQVLADAFLAGTPDPGGFHERAASCFATRLRWLPGLARRAFRKFGSSLLHPDRPALVSWIEEDRGYRVAWERGRVPRVVHVFLDPPRMAPRTGILAACDIPALATPGDLARWLGLSPGELDWFADLKGMNPAEGPLAHYRYKWIEKSAGKRLIEIPKHRLREIQRRILRGILEPIPIHHAAHGFRRGRSCITYAKPHVGRSLVLRLDLQAFFPSIPGPRVEAMFETLGYPAAVARVLAGLCTNSVPMAVARRGASTWLEAKRLGIPHLPQGAPTSPALANLCALHLDLRLDGLAKSLGANYTRYADDLALSGDEQFRRRAPAVARSVAAIAREEGFELHARKTRSMARGHRQVLTGIVVNERTNVRRAEFDRLKAILTNCARHGPASQNRDGIARFREHLAGRIAHVASLNEARAKKLATIFERIEWGLASPRGDTREPR